MLVGLLTLFISSRYAPAHLIKEVKEECDLNLPAIARGTFRIQNYDCPFSVWMHGKFDDLEGRYV